jgi:hypothetical protein
VRFCAFSQCVFAPLRQVGAPIPADKRLKFASELFDVVDVYGERQLNAQKLQAWRTCRVNTLLACVC